jgi:hypothetical protein
VLGWVLWVKTHPTQPKIPSGLGWVLPIKPDPARDQVGLGFENKTHPAGWVISGWVVGSGWVVRTLIVDNFDFRWKFSDSTRAKANCVHAPNCKFTIRCNYYATAAMQVYNTAGLVTGRLY